MLDEEARAEVVKHLLVRVCVYVERAFKIILRKHAQMKAELVPTLSRYFIEVESLGETDKRGANPSRNKILETMKKLDPVWSDQFKERLTTQNLPRNLANDLDSIVNYRNAIAHTGTIPVQSTFSDVKQYFESAKLIIKQLFQICRGQDQVVQESS